MPARLRFWLVLAWVGCGEPAPPAVPGPSPSTAPEAPVTATPSAPPAPPPICEAIGWGEEPAISPEARALNEGALVHQTAGRYAEAEAGFAAAVTASPSYRMARFNHACALSRLERHDEAWAELRLLLCAELPTFAPRASADPDLAAVRERSDVAGTIAAIAELYRSPSLTGTPMIAFEHGPAATSDDGRGGTVTLPVNEWEESQAGVYLAMSRRFVPMGPRLRARRAGEGAYPLVATHYDTRRRQVLSVVAQGNDSEDGGPLSDVEVTIHEAVTGARLVSHAIPLESGGVEAWLDGGSGALVARIDDANVRSVVRLGERIERVAPTRASPWHLSVRQLDWAWRPSETMAAPEAQVTLPDGRALALGGPPSWGMRSIRTTRDDDVVLVLEELHGECGERDRYRLERMTVSTGARVVLREGEGGYTIIEEAADESIYLQVHDETWRYPNRALEPAETLPRGIGLTGAANDFNPYC
jgi:hypothetical protein